MLTGPSRRAHAIWIVAFALSSAGAAALFGGGIAEGCVASALPTLAADAYAAALAGECAAGAPVAEIDLAGAARINHSADVPSGAA